MTQQVDAAPAAGGVRPQPHQVAALRRVSDEFARSDRAQLVMACGSGKTLVGRWLAESLGAETCLVVLPSLALVAQTLREWRAASGWDFDAVVVCSDPTTGRAWAMDSDTAPDGWERGVCVTTSPARVARRLAHRRQRPMVVFSTYHSSPVVADAAAAAEVVFDLAVADEAHHLAREPSDAFRTVLGVGFPAKKRLFMTATPVVIPHRDTGAGTEAGCRVLSMDDPFTFGRVAYRLSFADAIAAGVLADYRVVVFDETVGQGGGVGVADPAAAFAAACDQGLAQVLSFHGRVAKARAFAAAVDGQVTRDGRLVVARAISARDSTARRQEALRLLEEGSPDQVVIVASARCLTEGVDVPAVDGILFADPKHSDVDVVQSIGRVLRPGQGKSIGRVLVPVLADPGLDDGTVLASGRFHAAWRILQALRSADPRMAQEMETLTGGLSRRGRDGQHVRSPRLVEFRFNQPAEAELVARLVDPTPRRWRAMFDRLAQSVDAGAAPAAGTALDQWCQRQRVAHRRGLLSPPQVAALEEIPGWVWNTEEGKWVEQLRAVTDVATAAGGLDLGDADMMGHRVPHSSAHRAPKTVGQWCALQRITARVGTLPPARRDQLETVPGWSWNAVPGTDAGCVDVLAEYVAWKHDANVPAGTVEDDQPLGDWLQEVRSRKVQGVLSQALLDEITVVTPRGSGSLKWEPAETHWRLGLAGLRQFVAREGRTPAQGHVENVQGSPLRLGQWCTRQRHLHRHGQLDPARVAELEAIPGWVWEPGRVPVGRQRADVGGRRHGTRAAYSAGCRCVPCRKANSAYARRRQADAQAGAVALVSAVRAQEHVLGLLEAGALQGEVARAAGVSQAAVSKLAAGRVQRIRPQVESALLAVAPNVLTRNTSRH